jgi:hypothetical protein
MTQIDALPLARLGADDCKALKAAVSVDEDRPILNNVLLRDGIAEATNGRVLVRIPMVGPGGEEFALPSDCAGNRFLLHRSALEHVKGGTALEVDMRTGEVWVVAAGEQKDGYPIELPDAEIETVGIAYPDTDKVLPMVDGGYRTLRLGAPVIKAMLAFAGGTSKDPGSLTLMVPPEGEGEGVCTALTFRRRGEIPRTGLVMPMRSFDEGADAPEPTDKPQSVDPAQADAFPTPEGEAA